MSHFGTRSAGRPGQRQPPPRRALHPPPRPLLPRRRRRQPRCRRFRIKRRPASQDRLCRQPLADPRQPASRPGLASVGRCRGNGAGGAGC
eukprot:402964-Rhodomonas_salina.1